MRSLTSTWHLITLGLPVCKFATVLIRYREVIGSNLVRVPATPTPFRGFPQASAGLMLQIDLTSCGTSFGDIIQLRNTFKIQVLPHRKHCHHNHQRFQYLNCIACNGVMTDE
jgi:hypothetical protein